jgi:hypothetical protein
MDMYARNVYVRVCICVYDLHQYMSMHVCVCKRTFKSICLRTCIRICNVYAFTCKYVYKFVYVVNPCIHVNMRSVLNICIYSHMRSCV